MHFLAGVCSENFLQLWLVILTWRKNANRRNSCPPSLPPRDSGELEQADMEILLEWKVLSDGAKKG